MPSDLTFDLMASARHLPPDGSLGTNHEIATALAILINGTQAPNASVTPKPTLGDHQQL